MEGVGGETNGLGLLAWVGLGWDGLCRSVRPSGSVMGNDASPITAPRPTNAHNDVEQEW